MEKNEKILIINDEPGFSTNELASMVSGMTGISASVVSDNGDEFKIKNLEQSYGAFKGMGMNCMVAGCKKPAAHGTTQVALCEDHMHLAFKPTTYTRPIPKVGRNEKCICGSKKKFKHCCGK